MDHVVPLSLSGVCGVKRRVLDNDSNKVMACWKCNQDKAAIHPLKWFAAHPDYRRRMMQEAGWLSDQVRAIAGLLPPDKSGAHSPHPPEHRSAPVD